MLPLKSGDKIRVIAPSFGKQAKKLAPSDERAKQRLENLGYKVTFGNHLGTQFHLGTARAEDRAADFNEAFADKSVKVVMALTGGWSANEILPLIDWNTVRANPKPLVGYSDITVLHNAMYAKTGVVGYLGPNFSTLGRMVSWQYTLDNLQAVLTQVEPIQLKRSQQWGVRSRKRFATKPWQVLQPGEAKGILLGGNLGTFYLLQGTEYQPKFDQPFILLAEDDDEAGKYTAREFSRRLESVLQLPGVRQNIQGLLVGRFQPNSGVTAPLLQSILGSKQLGDIPVVTGIDFGHTTPTLTLPIGGNARLSAHSAPIRLELIPS